MPIRAYNSGDPYETLIAQMVSIERQPQLALKVERSNQSVFKGVLSDFDRSLSALDSALKGLTDTLANPFAARSSSVPDDAGFGVEVSDEAAPGSHTIAVRRLATADRRVSRQFDAGGTVLRDFFDANGPQTFELTVASPTADDAGRRVALPVTVDPTGATDAEVLAEVQKAIAGATDAAVADGTLEKRGHGAGASVVNETSETARLSLRSGETGFANRLGFADSDNGLLALLDVGGGAVASGTGGGAVTAVGTGDADSALNAQFDLDGLTLYRSANTVDDALGGVTLSLDRVGDETAFRVGADGDASKQEVEAFIEKYNAALTFIARKTDINPEKGTRGDFAGDSAVRGLRFGMRNDLAGDVAGQPPGLGRLSDLGIEVQDDGTLKLVDTQALQAAVERDPSSVQRLFAAEDGGLGTRLRDRLDAFLGTGGIVDARERVVDARTKRLDARISSWDDRLSQREDQLRQQYAKLQETLSLLQGQQQSLSSFFYGGGY
ncbi:flagellar filament capping protein FliD [Rubrivirga sp. S365]|uniref:flagellar filament capping protein FliD n=1 Tax=Rubrivirga sp. S365 TaxID=3076080 RepID=UPI0028C5A081|nr:flagellar filament capping protein FliD [Rubrivirga sp. S365]MDT7857317.1 flagellar filament capping protein FliD [Rubrivirga sp. S365]